MDSMEAKQVYLGQVGREPEGWTASQYFMYRGRKGASKLVDSLWLIYPPTVS